MTKASKKNELRQIRQKTGLTLTQMGDKIGRTPQTLTSMEVYNDGTHPCYKLYRHAYLSVSDGNK